MKTRFLTVVLSTVFMFTATQSFAQDGVGLGGELLSPTGLSYKIPINETSSINGGLGFFVTDFNSSLILEANYVIYRDSDNINVGSGDLVPYFGGGVYVTFNSDIDSQLAIQIPFGIEYRVDSSPIEVYMDIGPLLTLTDPMIFRATSSLGFRYRF